MLDSSVKNVRQSLRGEQGECLISFMNFCSTHKSTKNYKLSYTLLIRALEESIGPIKSAEQVFQLFWFGFPFVITSGQQRQLSGWHKSLWISDTTSPHRLQAL